MEKTTSAQKRL
jgi:hypothetical protein